MNGAREHYIGALTRLKHYLTDSLEDPGCPDGDACHVGLDAITELESMIFKGAKPWENYDVEEGQLPDGPPLDMVEAGRCYILLQRVSTSLGEEPEPNLNDMIQDGVGVDDT